MQSIEQHYYRETEEQNSNGCKLLVKKDAMLPIQVSQLPCSQGLVNPVIQLQPLSTTQDS